ncbi:MAG: hypothetical protein WCH82_12445 [Mycobacteriaceae bacterium]
MWLRQRDGVTCGPSVAVMAGTLINADYRRALQRADAQMWFEAEQGRVHRAANTVWPRALGTTPAGMARALSAHGTRYRWRPARRSLSDVSDAVAAGWPVAMLIGAAVPRHWVLLTEIDRGTIDRGTIDRGTIDRGTLRCYEPSSGHLIGVSFDDIRTGRLNELGFPRAFAFVLPAATRGQ